MHSDSHYDRNEVQSYPYSHSLCQQSYGQLGAQSGNVQSAFADERVKWVYGNIYECLQHGVKCRRRILFGSNYYCGWLLNDDLVRFDHELPCSKRGEENAYVG
jgi:hypothetical protein